MLSKVRCAHTGVVNFFEQEDPQLSLGSIIQRRSGQFVWRCHVSESGDAGTTRDIAKAEAALRTALRDWRYTG